MVMFRRFSDNKPLKDIEFALMYKNTFEIELIGVDITEHNTGLEIEILFDEPNEDYE